MTCWVTKHTLYGGSGVLGVGVQSGYSIFSGLRGHCGLYSKSSEADSYKIFRLSWQGTFNPDIRVNIDGGPPGGGAGGRGTGN